MKALKERWKIALYFTSEEQLENFNLLKVRMLASAENLQPRQTSGTKILYLKIEKHHFL